MADAKLTALPAATTVSGGDLVYGVQNIATVDTSVKITATQLKTWTSASPTLVTPDIGVATGTSLAASGVLSTGANGGTNGQLKLFGSTSGDVTIKPAAVAGTATIFQVPATNGTNNYVLTTNGSGVTSWGQVSLTAAVTGTLPVGNGGTGQTTLTQHGVLLGNATGAIAATTAGTANQVLVSSGASADPTWSTSTFPTTAAAGTVLAAATANTVAASATPTLGVAGTTAGTLALSGLTSGVVTVQTAAIAGTWSLTLPSSGGTANYALTTNGSGVSSWSQISLTAGVTGTLPVANGGTGQTTLTQYGVLLGNATGAISATSAGTANQVLVSSGASANPTWTTSTFPTTAAAGTILTAATANTVTASAAPVLGAVGTAGTLGLSGATSGVVTLQTAATAGTWSLTLPTTGGTNNYVLTTNGSGVSSWSQVSLTAGVTGVLPAANGGTGVNNGSSTITLGGSLTLSGAYTFTGTLTNTTAVTFPTSGTLATLAGAETLTNKRVSPRVTTITDNTLNPTFTVDSDSYDQVNLVAGYTAGISTVTIASPTGTPTPGQKLILRIYSTNTNVVSISFSGSNIVGSTDITLPTTLSGNSKYDYIGLIWNSASLNWNMISTVFGF